RSLVCSGLASAVRRRAPGIRSGENPQTCANSRSGGGDSGGSYAPRQGSSRAKQGGKGSGTSYPSVLVENTKQESRIISQTMDRPERKAEEGGSLGSGGGQGRGGA